MSSPQQPADELTTIRSQRDELIHHLRMLFRAEVRKDSGAFQMALGYLMLDLGNIDRSAYPFDRQRYPIDMADLRLRDDEKT